MTTDNQELGKILIKFGADCMEPVGQTMRVFNEAEAALLKWSDKRCEAVKQREVDLTIINLIKHGVFTEEDLHKAGFNMRAELRNKLEANHEG